MPGSVVSPPRTAAEAEGDELSADWAGVVLAGLLASNGTYAGNAPYAGKEGATKGSAVDRVVAVAWCEKT
jgi:hypothetical protein